MDFEFDGATLLYGIGLVLAVAALVYFMRDLVFGLSLTVKAILLVLAFASFLAAGIATERDVLDVVALALSGASYLAFVAYVNSNFGIDETGVFLLLAVSSALFVGLGYLFHERDATLPLRTAGYVVGAAALVGVVLVGADVATGDVTYDVQLEDSVTVEPPERAESNEPYHHLEGRLGTVTASNPFVFRRSLEPPSTAACIATPEDGRIEESHVSYQYPPSYDDWPRTIGGGETVEIGMTTHLRIDANATSSETFAIERGEECPEDVDEPTIVVTIGSQENFYPRPVALGGATAD